jgi:hypothetical protein
MRRRARKPAAFLTLALTRLAQGCVALCRLLVEDGLAEPLCFDNDGLTPVAVAALSHQAAATAYLTSVTGSRDR